jgi:hypothetical protein
MRNDSQPVVHTSSGTPDFGADGWAASAPKRLDVKTRVLCSGIALAALSLLIVAAVLKPAGGGLGTHEQLGLPQCGWIAAANMPCPTCGMTTAFSHAADGNLLASFRAQPMGALLALGTAIAVVAAGWSALTGSTLAVFLVGLFNARVGWLLLGFFIAAWVWKIIDHKGLF